jgi:hypothetical protein
VAQEPPAHDAHPPPPPLLVSPPPRALAPPIAKVENRLRTFGAPHLGQRGFRRSVIERNNSSNNLPHRSHENS